jgi:hypothetical protein
MINTPFAHPEKPLNHAQLTREPWKKKAYSKLSAAVRTRAQLRTAGTTPFSALSRVLRTNHPLSSVPEWQERDDHPLVSFTKEAYSNLYRVGSSHDWLVNPRIIALRGGRGVRLGVTWWWGPYTIRVAYRTKVSLRWSPYPVLLFAVVRCCSDSAAMLMSQIPPQSLPTNNWGDNLCSGPNRSAQPRLKKKHFGLTKTTDTVQFSVKKLKTNSNEIDQTKTANWMILW